MKRKITIGAGWLMFSAGFAMASYCGTIYRFIHPEKTGTQAFLDNGWLITFGIINLAFGAFLLVKAHKW